VNKKNKETQKMSNKHRTVGKCISETIDALSELSKEEYEECEKISEYIMEIALSLNEIPRFVNVLIIAKNLFIQKADDKGEDLC